MEVNLRGGVVEGVYRAGEWLEGHQYRFVVISGDADGEVKAFRADGRPAVGIILNKPAMGYSARIRHLGISLVMCDAPVTCGQVVQATWRGGAAPCWSGVPVGVALESGVPGMVVRVFLNPQRECGSILGPAVLPSPPRPVRRRVFGGEEA